MCSSEATQRRKAFRITVERCDANALKDVKALRLLDIKPSPAGQNSSFLYLALEHLKLGCLNSELYMSYLCTDWAPRATSLC